MTGELEKLDRILRRAEAAQLMGVAVATVDSWVQRGRLERPIQLGVNAVGWRLSTLEAFIAKAQRAPYVRNGRGRRHRNASLPEANNSVQPAELEHAAG
ncbi:helix-turn-helix transcriptional regulator [Paraburkholderia phenoliruptrix]|uniref:helix-turn-helix transcriptional regulator n=1 Tax=Paraburkholderia phenoliruptrix TaxID=252970 RepID=UPI0034D00A50